MTARGGNARRSRRKSARPATTPATPRPTRFPALRVLTSVKGAVLTLGALATAVAAVIALIPKSAPVSTVAAEFSNITLDPNTTLDQYETRFAGLSGVRGPVVFAVATGRWRSRLIDLTTSTAGGSATSASGQASTTGTSETTPTPTISTATATTTTETTSPTTLSTTPTAPPSTSTSISGPSGTPGPRAIFGTVRTTEIPAVARLLSTTSVPVPVPGNQRPLDAIVNVGSTASACGTDLNAANCAVAPQIEHELQRGVSANAAALNVAKIFASSRNEIINHQIHPIGVTVHFGLRLVGFESKVATLLWSLYSEGAADPLPEEWFRSVVAMQFKADVPDDSFEGRFWMPEPKRRGHYVVALTVLDNQGIERGEGRSQPFP